MAPELLLAVAVPAAVTAPHLLRLRSAAPATAATLWLLALMLRALLAIGAAVFVLRYLPRMSFLQALGRWCWHNIVPLAGEDLGFSGHRLAHAAAILPALALGASLLSVAFGVGRAMVAVALHVRRAVVGEGPLGTTLVRDPQVVVGVAGLGRGRVVISDAAVRELDPDELCASLAHERAHIRRWHRPLLVAGTLLAGIARWLPGTRAAEQGLVLSLERHADELAVAETRDPLALASAICKAARSSLRPAMALALTGGGQLGLRLEYLLGSRTPRRSPAAERGLQVLAIAMAATTLGLLTGLPTWAVALPPDTGTSPATSCPH